MESTTATGVTKSPERKPPPPGDCDPNGDLIEDLTARLRARVRPDVADGVDLADHLRGVATELARVRCARGLA